MNPWGTGHSDSGQDEQGTMRGSARKTPRNRTRRDSTCPTPVRPRYLAVGVASGLATRSIVAAGEDVKPLRAGIIGLDTSHVVAFTEAAQRPEGRGRAGGHPGRGGVPGREPGRGVEPRPRRGVHPQAPRRVRGRDRRLDRRPAREGGRRLAGERRRPPAPGAGRAGPEGEKAGLHRQAGRRHRSPTRSRSTALAERYGHALLLQLVAPLQPVDPGPEGRPQGRRGRWAATPTGLARWRSTTPTSSGTASTGSSRFSP